MLSETTSRSRTDRWRCRRNCRERPARLDSGVCSMRTRVGATSLVGNQPPAISSTASVLTPSWLTCLQDGAERLHAAACTCDERSGRARECRLPGVGEDRYGRTQRSTNGRSGRRHDRLARDAARGRSDGRLLQGPAANRLVAEGRRPGAAYLGSAIAHSPARMSGSAAPCRVTPSMSSRSDPIMKSTWTTLLFPPARSNSASLMTSPPPIVNL